MKTKTTVFFASFLLFVASGYAQSNSCAYTFTYPKAQFSFCVTVWGTLASIQSPIGVDHLDSLNPVEGWSAALSDNVGGGEGGVVIPGLGAVSWVNPPTVQQPNGPGTLPLIFNYGDSNNFREIVTASPFGRAVSLTLIIRSCQGDCYWYGRVSRVANIQADGSKTDTFAHSSFAAFGYFDHGVMLSVSGGENGGCGGTDPNGASTSTYEFCPASAPFNGTGAVFGSWSFSSLNGKPMSMNATYRVF